MQQSQQFRAVCECGHSAAQHYSHRSGGECKSCTAGQNWREKWDTRCKLSREQVEYRARKSA